MVLKRLWQAHLQKRQQRRQDLTDLRDFGKLKMRQITGIFSWDADYFVEVLLENPKKITKSTFYKAWYTLEITGIKDIQKTYEDILYFSSILLQEPRYEHLGRDLIQILSNMNVSTNMQINKIKFLFESYRSTKNPNIKVELLRMLDTNFGNYVLNVLYEIKMHKRNISPDELELIKRISEGLEFHSKKLEFIMSEYNKYIQFNVV